MIVLLRMQQSMIVRKISNNENFLSRVTGDGKRIEAYDIIERDPTTLTSSLVAEYYIFGEGPCSNRSQNPPPMKRTCTMTYHYHVDQNETLTVIEGTMGYYLGDKRRVHVAKKGQTVHIPNMTPHTFWSLTAQDLTVRVRVTPALKMAFFFENYEGIMRDAPQDLLNLWYTSLESGVYFGDFSIMMNRIFSVLVELVCRLAGKRPFYPEYSASIPRGYQ